MSSVVDALVEQQHRADVVERGDDPAARQHGRGLLGGAALLDGQRVRALLVEAERVDAVDDDLALERAGAGTRAARGGPPTGRRRRRGRPAAAACLVVQARSPRPAGRRRPPRRARPSASRARRGIPASAKRRARPRPCSPVPPRTATVEPGEVGGRGRGRSCRAVCAGPGHHGRNRTVRVAGSAVTRRPRARCPSGRSARVAAGPHRRVAQLHDRRASGPVSTTWRLEALPDARGEHERLGEVDARPAPARAPPGRRRS